MLYPYTMGENYENQESNNYKSKNNQHPLPMLNKSKKNEKKKEHYQRAVYPIPFSECL